MRAKGLKGHKGLDGNLVLHSHRGPDSTTVYGRFGMTRAIIETYSMRISQLRNNVKAVVSGYPARTSYAVVKTTSAEATVQFHRTATTPTDSTINNEVKIGLYIIVFLKISQTVA